MVVLPFDSRPTTPLKLDFAEVHLLGAVQAGAVLYKKQAANSTSFFLQEILLQHYFTVVEKVEEKKIIP